MTPKVMENTFLIHLRLPRGLEKHLWESLFIKLLESLFSSKFSQQDLRFELGLSSKPVWSTNKRNQAHRSQSAPPWVQFSGRCVHFASPVDHCFVGINSSCSDEQMYLQVMVICKVIQSCILTQRKKCIFQNDFLFLIWMDTGKTQKLQCEPVPVWSHCPSLHKAKNKSWQFS